MALLIGVPLSVLLYQATPHFYPYLRSDPEVVAVGVPYLRARLVAVAAVGMNFAFRGYFNGVNRSKIYMRSLLVMHACNLVLNYGLIYGHLGMPKLGAVGAGVGTAIATYVATAIYLLMAHRHARQAGFLRGIPDRATMRTMATLSVPSGVQQAFFATGLTALFWIVGQIGTTAGAAANVLITLMLVAILPAMGLGMAAASLVGQALGRGDPDDAERWGWDVVRMAMAALFVIGLPMLIAPRLLLSIFTTDVATIEVGTLPLRIVGGSIFIDAVGMVLQGAMLGAGDSRRVMVVSVALQWGLFLPCAYLVGPLWGMGLLGIWVAQIGQRLLQSGIFAWMWRRRRWADVTV
jgi:putative MATE family efflux protein